MKQLLIATSPSQLLASAFANVAFQVGGYKDGFPVQSAHQSLHNLFNAPVGSDEFNQAFDTLKSLWDRSEGASEMIGRMGDKAPRIEVDLTTNSILINGEDTRSELDLEIADLQIKTLIAGSALEVGAGAIERLLEENGKLKAMVQAAAGVEGVETVMNIHVNGDGFSSFTVDYPCDVEAPSNMSDYVKAA